MSHNLRVAVVGAGIIGVGSALRIQQFIPGVTVTIISEKFSPDTTGDGSAGLIHPYALGSDADEQTIRNWCEETMEFLQEIALSEKSNALGVSFVNVYFLSERPEGVTTFADMLINWGRITDRQRALFPPEYKFGVHGTTIYAECKKLLPALMKKFQDLGGKIEKRSVKKLTELFDSYELIVNCTGLQSSQLVPDPSVYPIRGQVIKVKAPWVKYMVSADNFHVIPNSDVVTLGGTKQKGNWSTEVNAKDREDIWNGCCKLIPSLKDAEVIEDWVGLRPGRDIPRLEKEVLQHKGNNITLIHNYGHGGSGVSLFWGCAGQVTKIIQETLYEN